MDKEPGQDPDATVLPVGKAGAQAAADSSELTQDEAVAAVAASVRRLFAFVSEQQAREVAAAVLRDLQGKRIRLFRGGGGLG